jgi:hypothetical protein
MKCHIHYMLVGGWNIFQSKRHDYLNKYSQIGNEGSLVHVFRGDHDLMITRKGVDFMSYLPPCLVLSL